MIGAPDRPSSDLLEALSNPQEGKVAHILVLVGEQFLEDVVQRLSEALERRPDALLGRRVRRGRSGGGPVKVLRLCHLVHRDAGLGQQTPEQRVGE